MKNIKYLSICALTAIVAGCNSDEQQATYSAPVPSIVKQTIPLIGTGGDMSKLLGSWKSGCGYDLLKKESAYVTFKFTNILDGAVLGEAFTTTYPSIDCSGTAKFGGIPTQQSVIFIYKSSFSIVSKETDNPRYTGNGDIVRTDPLSQGTESDLYIGFDEKFTKFTLSRSNEFSSLEMTYSKR